jgi:endonuclease/exonuclease/phosphatase (EEP) superfamily protein YafD
VTTIERPAPTTRWRTVLSAARRGAVGRDRLGRHSAVPVWGCVAVLLAWTALRVAGVANTYPVIQLLAFTPYLLPAAVVLTVLCGLCRRWMALAATAVTLIVLATLVVPRAVGGPDPDGGGTRLRVLSANMKVGASDADNLVALVRAHDVDVLALQEFTASAQRRLRDAGLESLLPYQISYPDKVQGSALYSRLPLTDGGYRPLPPDFGQAYGVLHLPDGHTVRVESAHPCAPYLAELSAAWRAGQARQPRADPGHGPRILLGDFNATFDHGPFRQLVDSGYTDVARHLGRGLTPTWPYDGRPVPKVTLDHVLVSGLRAYDFAAYPNPGSDHRAVYAELGLS